jgi:hypothetical protein
MEMLGVSVAPCRLHTLRARPITATSQSYDDHGGFKGSGSEFAEMICAPAGRAGQLNMHHLLGQSVFDVHGDEAWGETFFVMHALIGGQVTAGLRPPGGATYLGRRRASNSRTGRNC